jgi:hypothetical protein
MIVILGIAFLSSCTESKSTNIPVKGEGVLIRAVDGCLYLKFWDGESINYEHSETCKNENHRRVLVNPNLTLDSQN